MEKILVQLGFVKRSGDQKNLGSYLYKQEELEHIISINPSISKEFKYSVAYRVCRKEKSTGDYESRILVRGSYHINTTLELESFLYHVRINELFQHK